MSPPVQHQQNIVKNNTKRTSEAGRSCTLSASLWLANVLPAAPAMRVGLDPGMVPPPKEPPNEPPNEPPEIP